MCTEVLFTSLRVLSVHGIMFVQGRHQQSHYKETITNRKQADSCNGRVDKASITKTT